MRSSDGREMKKRGKNASRLFRDKQDEWTAQAVITIGISVHNDTFGYVNIPPSAKNDRFAGPQMEDEKTQRWSEQTVSRETHTQAGIRSSQIACQNRTKMPRETQTLISSRLFPRGRRCSPRVEDEQRCTQLSSAKCFFVLGPEKNYRFQLLSDETMRKSDKKVQKQKEEERKQKGTSCCAQRAIFCSRSDRKLDRNEGYARGEGKYRITFLLLASVALIFIK